MARTVRDLQSSSEFRKALYLDHCYSTYLYVTYSKLNTFARIPYSLKSEQRKLPLNAFITPQFSYAKVV